MLKRRNPELSKILVDQNINEIFYSHDNWNGGIDIYDIVIRVPIDFFEQLKSKGIVEESEFIVNDYEQR